MTYGAIQARVSGEMKRGELSVSSTAVQNSVIDAINHFELRRMWFNHGFSNTIVTVADAPTLPSSPVGIVKIDSFKISIGNRNYPITPMSFRQMDRIDSGQWSGYPEYYAHYRDALRLYPIPNA